MLKFDPQTQLTSLAWQATTLEISLGSAGSMAGVLTNEDGVNHLLHDPIVGQNDTILAIDSIHELSSACWTCMEQSPQHLGNLFQNHISSTRTRTHRDQDPVSFHGAGSFMWELHHMHMHICHQPFLAQTSILCLLQCWSRRGRCVQYELTRAYSTVEWWLLGREAQSSPCGRVAFIPGREFVGKQEWFESFFQFFFIPSISWAPSRNSSVCFLHHYAYTYWSYVYVYVYYDDDE
jgi:hypothetical protein